MFTVMETTAGVVASGTFATEDEAQAVCDSYNYHAANAVWNTLNYEVTKL